MRVAPQQPAATSGITGRVLRAKPNTSRAFLLLVSECLQRKAASLFPSPNHASRGRRQSRASLKFQNVANLYALLKQNGHQENRYT